MPFIPEISSWNKAWILLSTFIETFYVPGMEVKQPLSSRRSHPWRNLTTVASLQGGHLLREWHWAAFRCAKVKSLSCAPLFATPWSVATRLLRQQAMEFFRQEYWSGLPFPSPGDLPDPGIEPGSPTLQARLSHREALDGQKIQSNNKKWQEREKSMCTRP